MKIDLQPIRHFSADSNYLNGHTTLKLLVKPGCPNRVFVFGLSPALFPATPIVLVSLEGRTPLTAWASADKKTDIAEHWSSPQSRAGVTR
ncbi:hypothetical protein E4U21_003262 [Claviceps maximensis]|nr:hypothetical protein E4U21_003262 [Claviceps maximensis]